jgi:hypothetical protein
MSELRQILIDMRRRRWEHCVVLAGVTEVQMATRVNFAMETMLTGKSKPDLTDDEKEDVRWLLLRFSDHLEEHALQAEDLLCNHLNIRRSEGQMLLAAIQRARGDLWAALVGLTDADLDVEPVDPPGEFPLRRILVHLISVEQNYRKRATLAIESHRAGKPYPGNPPMPPSVERSTATLAELIAELDAEREITLDALMDVSDAELKAPQLWGGIQIDVRFQILRYGQHEREHTAHIRKWRQQTDRAETDAQRLLGLAWQQQGYLEGVLLNAPDSALEQSAGEGEWTLQRMLADIPGGERYYRRLIDEALG